MDHIIQFIRDFVDYFSIRVDKTEISTIVMTNQHMYIPF